MRLSTKREVLALAPGVLVWAAGSCALGQIASEGRRQTTVANVEQLLNAYSHARDNDVIRLAPGTYNERILLSDKRWTKPVLLTSADPAAKAKLTNFDVRDSEGVDLADLDLDAGVASAALRSDFYGFRLTRSSRLTMRRCQLYDRTRANPKEDRAGLLVQDCAGVLISRNEFHNVFVAITLNRGRDIQVLGNYFHDIRSDGIDCTSSTTTISKNFFTEFYPREDDHPDTIQLFDDKGVPPSKVTINGNVYLRGRGQASQGIFARLDDDKPIRFDDLTITDNFYAGPHYTGITVVGGRRVKIADNTVVAFEDYDSRIWVGNSSDVTQSNNSAAQFIYGIPGHPVSDDPKNTNSRVVHSRGSTTPPVRDGGARALNRWLAQHQDMAWVLQRRLPAEDPQ